MDIGETLSVDLIYLISYVESLGAKPQYDYIVRTVKITRVDSPLKVVFKGIENQTSEIEVG